MAAGIAMGIAVARLQIWPAVRLGVNLNRKSAKWAFFSPSASSSYSSSSSAVPRTLILYSKPGCCLCDGLKEKLDAAFSLSGPNSLHDVQLQVFSQRLSWILQLSVNAIKCHSSLDCNDSNCVSHFAKLKVFCTAPKNVIEWWCENSVETILFREIRDITSNPEWERLYQYEIPVLARVHDDGTEETLPRLSPRIGVELIQKKIAAAFSE